MDTDTCLTCGAIVHVKLVSDHQNWHKNIAEVAIESTQRIDALIERLRHLIGYDDDR